MAYTDIDKPTDYFNTKLYTGTGSSNAITGVGFQPDLTWIKSRSVAGSGHRLHDSVRGAGNMLASDSNGLEFDDSALFTSFDTDGFTVAGTGSSYNGSSQTYASWNWLKSTTSGFDIVTYTGNASNSARAISHSLGATPGFMLTKNRTGTQVTGTDKWVVFNKSFVAGDYIHLDQTAAKLNSSGYWGGTLPNSSNFYVGGTSSNVHNESGIDYVAYLWAEKKGYSKFGSYTGNGNADGTFIYTGFKPAWILIKNTNATQSWRLIDNKRFGYNVDNIQLYPNLSNAESTTETVADILSNGFKIRATDIGVNGSGNTLIYMAFSENPFTTSTGIPTTSR